MLGSQELVTAFILFAFVSSITPGPNNTLLLASGVNFGVRRSIPHALGVSIGFAVMVLAVGLGLGEVFKLWPVLYTVLRYAGAAYLLYLAWKIATSGPPKGQAEGTRKPMTFLGAAAFQWVNPKAWVMAVGAITTYTPAQGYFFNVLVIAALFAVVNIPSTSAWVVFGSALRRVLQNPRYLTVFNVIMALLLVASLYPLLVTDHHFA